MAASSLSDHPDVWTDGSLVLDRLTGVSSSGSGFFARKTEHFCSNRWWGHVDGVCVDPNVASCRGFCSVPGPRQSVLRAEMWRVILALQACGAVHLGVDNLGVVRHVGRLLDGCRGPIPFELVNDGDLLLLIERMLHHRGLDTVRISEREWAQATRGTGVGFGTGGQPLGQKPPPQPQQQSQRPQNQRQKAQAQAQSRAPSPTQEEESYEVLLEALNGLILSSLLEQVRSSLPKPEKPLTERMMQVQNKLDEEKKAANSWREVVKMREAALVEGRKILADHGDSIYSTA